MNILDGINALRALRVARSTYEHLNADLARSGKSQRFRK